MVQILLVSAPSAITIVTDDVCLNQAISRIYEVLHDKALMVNGVQQPR